MKLKNKLLLGVSVLSISMGAGAMMTSEEFSREHGADSPIRKKLEKRWGCTIKPGDALERPVSNLLGNIKIANHTGIYVGEDKVVEVTGEGITDKFGGKVKVLENLLIADGKEAWKKNLMIVAPSKYKGLTTVGAGAAGAALGYAFGSLFDSSPSDSRTKNEVRRSAAGPEEEEEKQESNLGKGLGALFGGILGGIAGNYAGHELDSHKCSLDSPRKVDDGRFHDRRLIVQKAKSQINKKWDYNFVANNCQHFVTSCQGTEAFSWEGLGEGKNA